MAAYEGNCDFYQHHLPRASCRYADGSLQPLVKPLSILVVDDSLDNRFLIEAYLEGLPHQLTFAADGYAALARWHAAPFDLILMDIHMPILDGLAATRSIRALERKTAAPAVPIVALTGESLPEDVAASLVAGCNSHLIKPYSQQALLGAIEQYARRSPVPLESHVAADLAKIVPGYLANRREELPHLQALVAAADFAALATLAHNIKGSGGLYGFPAISRLGAALEESAKRRDPKAARAHLSRLTHYLDRATPGTPP